MEVFLHDVYVNVDIAKTGNNIIIL